MASALHFDPSQREEEHPTAAGHAEILPIARHAFDYSEKHKGDEEGDGDAALGDYFGGNEVSSTTKIRPCPLGCLRGNLTQHFPGAFCTYHSFKRRDHPGKVKCAMQSACASKLNEKQTVAIQRALQRPFSMVQGPPGTGKTSMLVQCVAALLSASRQRWKGRFDETETHWLTSGRLSNWD